VETLQAPLRQASPTPHLMPHPPQLSLSTCVLMQTPLQEFWPGAHPQVPLLQVWPFWQVVPHVPQMS
jgi:hypothetical protein